MKKIYFVEGENLQQELATIDALLALVEVKGESVVNLFKARMMLNDIYKSIEEKSTEEREE